ncbi:MAG: hypothetical protein EB084_26415 [Proteobacteria bacterium]|nr:hypothetical protein [Pseudomonadota bacterium]
MLRGTVEFLPHSSRVASGTQRAPRVDVGNQTNQTRASRFIPQGQFSQLDQVVACCLDLATLADDCYCMCCDTLTLSSRQIAVQLVDDAASSRQP